MSTQTRPLPQQDPAQSWKFVNLLDLFFMIGLPWPPQCMWLVDLLGNFVRLEVGRNKPFLGLTNYNNYCINIFPTTTFCNTIQCFILMFWCQKYNGYTFFIKSIIYPSQNLDSNLILNDFILFRAVMTCHLHWKTARMFLGWQSIYNSRLRQYKQNNFGLGLHYFILNFYSFMLFPDWKLTISLFPSLNSNKHMFIWRRCILFSEALLYSYWKQYETNWAKSEVNFCFWTTLIQSAPSVTFSLQHVASQH